MPVRQNQTKSPFSRIPHLYRVCGLFSSLRERVVSNQLASCYIRDMSILHLPTTIFQYLSYDPDTGVITWVKNTGKKAKVGKPAGTVSTTPRGYSRLQIQFKGKIYKAHRVAWYLHTGSQPPAIIDHINNDATDNRWENLRDGTNGVNPQNMKDRDRDLPRYVSEGYPGNFRARAYRDGKYLIDQSGFRSAEEAHQAALDSISRHELERTA